jgi:hypothetical protein
MGNTVDLYSDGPGLESRPETLAVLTDIFRGFPKSFQEISKVTILFSLILFTSEST